MKGEVTIRCCGNTQCMLLSSIICDTIKKGESWRRHDHGGEESGLEHVCGQREEQRPRYAGSCCVDV